MSVELALALNRIGKPRVLVVGDYIADIDVECQPHRFAQEAPHCPVWKHSHPIPKYTAGGAGAVCEMAKALGADAFLISAFLPYQATKTRYFVNGVQQLRIDTDARPLEPKESDRIAAHVADSVERADCVLVADYGKGVCTKGVLQMAIDGARACNIPCIVDPHQHEWHRYVGATCLKLNHQQTCQQSEKLDACEAFQWIVETRGIEGITLAPRYEFRFGDETFSCRPRQVVDVTGAGDMVLAALGVCVSSGISWPDACRVANSAAGLKCERRGAVPVPLCEVIVDLLTGIHVIPSELLPVVSQAAKTWNGCSLKVVWTNGCFDGGLHAGHLHLLEEAKKQGDMLIVGVNTDESVNYLKGPSRPIRKLAERSAVVAALACVDYVVQIGSEGDLAYCIEEVKPDVLVKGSDWRGQSITGAEHAGRVHFVERLAGVSTTALSHELKHV